MAVKGFDSRKQLAVVAAGDKDLSVTANSSLEDGQRARRELVLLELGDLILGQLGAGLALEFSGGVSVC